MLVIKLLLITILFVGIIVVIFRPWAGWLLILGPTLIYGAVRGFIAPSRMDLLLVLAIAVITQTAVWGLRYLLKIRYRDHQQELLGRLVGSSATLLLFAMFLGPAMGSTIWWTVLGHRMVPGLRVSYRFLFYLILPWMAGLSGATAAVVLVVYRVANN